METKCANPKCDLPLKGTNPKKRFCNIHCKNKAAYLYRLKKYNWEEQMQKKRRKNIQILEYLVSIGYFKVSKNELRIMGFHFNASLIAHKDKNGLKALRFGNIYLVLITETDCEIELVKEETK